MASVFEDMIVKSWKATKGVAVYLGKKFSERYKYWKDLEEEENHLRFHDDVCKSLSSTIAEIYGFEAVRKNFEYSFVEVVEGDKKIQKPYPNIAYNKYVLPNIPSCWAYSGTVYGDLDGALLKNIRDRFEVWAKNYSGRQSVKVSVDVCSLDYGKRLLFLVFDEADARKVERWLIEKRAV